MDKMITLQYFNGIEWMYVSSWHNEASAWASLGNDCYGYRTVDSNGNELTTMLKTPTPFTKTE